MGGGRWVCVGAGGALRVAVLLRCLGEAAVRQASSCCLEGKSAARAPRLA